MGPNQSTSCQQGKRHLHTSKQCANKPICRQKICRAENCGYKSDLKRNKLICRDCRIKENGADGRGGAQD